MSRPMLLARGVPALLLLALAGCAVPADPGARAARQSLKTLQADPKVSANAPQALADAERAVVAAEAQQADKTEAAHSAYVAQVRVLIARYRASTVADSNAAVALTKRRDEMRHGNDAITTLATDAFNATPHKQKFVPITKDTPFPVTAPPTEIASAPPPAAPTAPVEYAPVVAPTPPPGPVATLQPGAFAGNALSNSGRLALDQALIPLARFPDRMIVIGGTPARVAAVRGYLLSVGVPGYRLAANAEPAAVEVRLEFGGASPG